MKTPITFTRLGNCEYDAEFIGYRESIDYHIRYENGQYTVDVFNSTSPTPKAHIESVAFDEWRFAFEYVFNDASFRESCG